MAYAVVYKGKVIGHTDLEARSGDLGMASGRLRPTRALGDFEKELRPFATASITVIPGGGPPSWVDSDKKPLPRMQIDLVDPQGNRLDVTGVRVFWPGDVPGRHYLGVLAIITLSTPVRPSAAQR